MFYIQVHLYSLYERVHYYSSIFFCLDFRYLENHLSESELEEAEQVRAEKSFFARHLMLSTLGEQPDDEEITLLPKLPLLRDLPDKLLLEGIKDEQQNSSVQNLSPSPAPSSAASAAAPRSTPTPTASAGARGPSTNSPAPTPAPVLTPAPQIPVNQRRKPVCSVHSESPNSAH